MLETIKKIGRGFLGAVAGLIVGPIPFLNRALGRFGWGRVSGVVLGYGIIVSCISMGLYFMGIGSILIGWIPMIIPYGLFGINNAIKCAYSAYYLGFVEGMKTGLSEDSVGLRRTKAKVQARVQQVQQLDSVPTIPARKFQPLSEAEEKIFFAQASAEEKQSLVKYNELMNNACSITQNDFKDYVEEKKQANLITLERERKKELAEGGSSVTVTETFTFDREGLKSWAQTKPTNPFDGSPISTHTAYCGFPKWMSDFVQKARKKIASLAKSPTQALQEVKTEISASTEAPQSLVQSQISQAEIREKRWQFFQKITDREKEKAKQIAAAQNLEIKESPLSSEKNESRSTCS